MIYWTKQLFLTSRCQEQLLEQIKIKRTRNTIISKNKKQDFLWISSKERGPIFGLSIEALDCTIIYNHVTLYILNNLNQNI